MLTIYKPPAEDDLSRSQYRKIVPIGTPYLTKVNGRLVFARDKPKKSSKLSLNLLGEVFGYTTKIVRKRSKSVEKPPKGPIIIDGVTYVPQFQQTPYSAPILQQPFPASAVPLVSYLPYTQYPIQQHPQSYAIPVPAPAPAPTEKELKQLTKISADFNKSKDAEAAKKKEELAVIDVPEVRTTITVIKHICANCGRLRSRKYHHENPIKPGETPLPAFCRKCQRDASSTSCSPDSGEKVVRKTKSKNSMPRKQKEKGERQHIESEYDIAEEHDENLAELLKPAESEDVEQKKKTRSKEQLSKNPHLEKTTALEISVTPKERQQSRGRIRNRGSYKENAEVEPARSPTPPVGSPKESSNSQPTSHQRDTKRESGYVHNIPFENLETNWQPPYQRSPVVQSQVFEAIPVYHDFGGQNDVFRGLPMHFIGRHFFDQPENLDPKQDIKTHEQPPPTSHFGKPEVVSADVRQSYSKEFHHHQNQKHMTKQQGFDGRKSHNQSVSSQIEDFDEPQIPFKKLASSAQHAPHVGEVKYNLEYSKGRYSRHNTTNRNARGHTEEERGTRISRSDSSRSAHPPIPPLKVSSSAPEYLVKMREPPCGKVPSEGHISRGQNRVRSLKSTKDTESVQSSSSNSTRASLQNSISSKHSKLSEKKAIHKQESEEMHNQGYKSREPSRGQPTRHNDSKSPESVSSKDPDAVEIRRRRGQNSPIQSFPAAWNDGDEMILNSHNNLEEAFTSTDAFDGRENIFGAENAEPLRRRKAFVEDEDISKSSQHDKSLHTSRSERNLPFEHVESSRDANPSQSTKRHNKAREPREQGSHRLLTRQKLTNTAKIQFVGADEIVTDTAFSTADAAKYYKNDWSNYQPLRQGNETKRNSTNSGSDTSSPELDASKYYQENWEKNEPTHTSEDERPPYQNFDSQERNPTSSEISRYHRGPDSFALPKVPSPPSPFSDRESDLSPNYGETQQSPPHRYPHKAPYKGKEFRTPSTIFEANESLKSKSHSSHSSRIGNDISKELSVVRKVQPQSLQQTAQCVNDEGDEEYLSSSESNSAAEAERNECTEQNGETGTAGAGDGWYTVTESMLDMIERQAAVPGFGESPEKRRG